MKFDESLSLYDVLKKTAEDNPNGIAIYYQKKKIKYKKFLKLVNKEAYILETKLKLKKNDVISISLPNIPQVLILLYAANKLGVVCDMIHPFTPYNQLKFTIDRVKAKYAFVFEQRVAKEVEKYRSIQDKIFVCRIEDFLPLFSRIFYHLFMNLFIRKKLGKGFKKKAFKYYHQLKGKNKSSSWALNNGLNLALFLHSGSTTGDPKTIEISNKSMNFIASKGCEEMGLDENSLKNVGMVSFLPSFHGFGLGMTMHTPIFNSMAVVLIPKFSPKAIVDAINHTYVGTMCGVPSAYESLVNSPIFQNCKKISRFKAVFSGGDSLPLTTQKKWKEIIKKHNGESSLLEGYGLTESIAAIVVNTRNNYKETSLGHPLEGVVVEIRKEDGSLAKPNEIGEITIKSPSNMIGYYLDKKATENAVKNGFVFTGDLGYMDEDGFIFFASRKKRVVKVSGVAVFPNEIEHLVESVRGVEKVCAISIPDKRLQKAIKLIVVTNLLDKEGLSQEIMDTCRKYLIKWSVPKAIEFRDDLPLTKLNKVDFKALQEEEDKKYN